MWLYVVTFTLLVAVVDPQATTLPQEENCLIDSSAGCYYAREPQYMIIAPKKIRPNQVFQIFASIFRMEYNQEYVHVHVAIVQGDVELANSVLRFDRPSSRIMQLQMPSNAKEGKYKLRVEGRIEENDAGNIWQNETDIDFTTKQASLFLQMSRPIYRQGQKVHFRVIPILPNMMPKYGSMIIYVDDPTGIPVRRWQGLQTNAGGIVSQSFQLSDQPNFGIWNIRVDAFGHTYRHPFRVEEFWEPRFDVNVSVAPYVMVSDNMRIRGVVLTNHTSGRPCVGNASITAFFRPREAIWNATRGWEKPYWDAMNSGSRPGVPLEKPSYRPVHTIPAKDYYMYFQYEYRFIPYFEGRIDFEWGLDQLKIIAERAQERDTLVDSEILFFVNVSDWYSGLNRTGYAGTVLFDSRIKLRWVGGPVRTFKPSSIMTIQVAVMKYDGTPVRGGGTVTVTDVITEDGQTGQRGSGPQIRTPVNGIAEFEYTLSSTTKNVLLTATYQDATQQTGGYLNPNFQVSNTKPIKMYAWRYYSPTNSYITIMTSTNQPQVNEYMVFHVKTSYYVPRIYYQVIAQSNIIIGDELEMTSRQKTFAIALSREMVPEARIIVYFIRQPEEVVIDVLNFFVNGTRQNQVRLGINRGKDFSRDTIEFNAEADPGSYVAFSGMLLDLYGRGLSDGVTENKLIDELMTFDATHNSSYKQLWRISDTEYEYKFFHAPDYGIDANTSFNTAGLLVLTDARVPRLINVDSCTPEKPNPCYSGVLTECYSEKERCDDEDEPNCPNDAADEWGCVYTETQEIHTDPMDRISRVMRFYDNSTWAWQEIFVKPDGHVDFRVDVPKYPLSWVINGISVSRELGLGIMQRPVRYDAARYMYIQVEHPKHIIRGEQIGVRVTVFNYWYDDDYLEVLITMHGGKDTEFVTVGDMGYVTSYTPTTHKGDHQTIVFLEPGDSRDIYMPIIPDKELIHGELTFRVSATCFMERDEYVGKMTVQPDGVLNYFFTPFLVDLIRYGSIQFPQFSIAVPEQFRVPEVRENKYVPGSPKSTVGLFGDVVTPGFFEDYLNAENLMYRPYGGGEMITFNFAYNALSLKFMKASKQLDDDQLIRSLHQMNIALQRVLSYMNATDGSFKMFRDDPTPSLWLSAFVAKSLSDANFGEWERDLFIPRELINKISLYICSRQNETTGAFEPDYHDVTYDRKMTSLKSLKTDKLYAHPIPLTAYVLIALQSIKDASEEAATCVQNARGKAASYLSGQITNIDKDEVFHMAITTYALTLTAQQKVPFNDLWKLRRNDSDNIYFADEVVYANSWYQTNAITYLDPRQELMNEAYGVQTTAYALMAHISSNQPFESERQNMMAWISNMRNSFGGFASTQDTIIAMEALFKFTQVDAHRNVFDLEVQVDSTASPNWKTVFKLDQSNYVRLLTSSLPSKKVFGYTVQSAQGAGRAMFGLMTTSNVEYSWLQKQPMHYQNDDGNDVMKFFDLVVDELRFSGRNDSIMEMTNCVSWLYHEKSLTSGLAVLEVDIPTGYVVMNDTLRDYVRSRIVPNLRRAEFYGRKVVFYFDYLDASKSCVYFRADRWYPVANATIQHRMRVYDYYEPGMHNTTLYTTRNLFLLNICFVCGSYQCPYCPYFNAATIARAGINVIFFLAAVYIVQKLLFRNR